MYKMGEKKNLFYPIVDSEGVKIAETEEYKDAVKIIEALEKQIPKEIEQADIYTPKGRIGLCQCGEHLHSDEHSYCYKCGQRIKW